MKKPKCKLIGKDGNVFNLIGLVSVALRKAKLTEQVAEMRNRVFKAGSYDEALVIMDEYVEIC